MIAGLTKGCNFLSRILLACAATVLVFRLLPAPPLVNKPGFSHAITDSSGKLLQLTLSSDERYRLWTPLAEIPPAMIESTLTQEDRHFYYHPGVNPISLIRGAVSTYLTDSRRIGGSTITMQLARIRFGINSRTLFGKLKQIGLALFLETHYSKAEILESYLNLISYGGNIEGVGAASLIYFGHPARALSYSEALTLAVIPQHPSKRSPVTGKPSELATARGILSSQVLSKETSEQTLLQVEVATRRSLPYETPHLVRRVEESLGKFGAKDTNWIRTTISLSDQHLLESQLHEFLTRNQRLGFTNATALLVHTPTMSVRGYVGSAEFFNSQNQGQVDGILGKRSPGSALKPFLYALALDQGKIHSESVLKDISFSYSTFNPENFDRDFLGPISATDALIRSRNLPAIELANSLAPPGFYGLLKSANISGLREESYYGLALVLGGVEVSMEELVKLYAALKNQGVLQELKFVEDKQAESPSQILFSPEASYITLEMLSKNPRPHQGLLPLGENQTGGIPWKTGTSNGFRDAWAVGVIGEYILGVWLGNFNGAPNPNLVGREAAGPLFFSIADALISSSRFLPSKATPPNGVRKVQVCALSGELPGPHCRELKDSLFLPGKSPISTCSVHREIVIDEATGLRACPGQSASIRKEVREFWPSDLLKLFRSAGIARTSPPPYAPSCNGVSSTSKPPNITSPVKGVSYPTRGLEPAIIPLLALSDADSAKVYWFADDRLIGSANSGETIFFHAPAGEYAIRAVDEQGGADSVVVRVEGVMNGG